MISEYHKTGETKEARFKAMMVIYGRGISEKKAGNYTSAMLEFKEITRTFPQNEMSKRSWMGIYFLIGQCYYYQTKFSKAMVCFEKAKTFDLTPTLKEFLQDTDRRLYLQAALNVLGGASFLNDRVEGASLR